MTGARCLILGRGGLFAVLLGCLWAEYCSAQLGFSVQADQKKYVRYEPVTINIILRNYSGHTLAFGREQSKSGYLEFLIEEPGGRDARKLDRSANPVANLILGAGETKQLTLILNTLYDMQKEGIYTIRAQIGHHRLQHDYRSDHLTIEIRDGLPVWTQTIGVPSSERTGAIAPRTVSLLVVHERGRGYYCFRVEDDKQVYGVIRLGPRIAGSKPECDIDAFSNIHILFQIQPRLYAYRVYDYKVELKQDRYYLATSSVPRLNRDPDIGRIMVIGGQPAIPGVDFQFIDQPEDQGRADAEPR